MACESPDFLCTGTRAPCPPQPLLCPCRSCRYTLPHPAPGCEGGRPWPCTEVTHHSQAALVKLEKAQISLLTGVEQHLCDLQLPSAGNCAVPEPDGQCFTAGHVSPADTEAEHPWDQDLQQPSASHTSPSNAMHKSHLISRDFVARCVCGKLILVQKRTEGQAGFKHGSKL